MSIIKSLLRRPTKALVVRSLSHSGASGLLKSIGPAQRRHGRIAGGAVTTFAPLLLAPLLAFAPAALADVPSASAPATQAVTQSDPSLISELESLQEKLGQVRDLSTRFTQEKHTALLRKPLISSGTVRIVGNLMRWDTLKPAASVMLIGENEIRLYYPDQKLLEVYAFDQQMARMAASPVPRISLMREYFEVGRAPAQSAETLGVELTPKQPSLREHVQKVSLLIDRRSGYLRQMEMVDADGDRTVTRFEDVKMNAGLSAGDLALKLPGDVRISHPMSGDGAAQGAEGAQGSR